MMNSIKLTALAGMIGIALCCCAKTGGTGNSLTPSSSASASPSPEGERLTTAKAEAALKRWAGSHGTVSVTGVQEIPRENSARADITLTDYHFTSKDAFLGDAQKIYTGAGAAIFIRYNDGRWMLSKVVFTMRGGMMFTFDNINIEAR